MPRLVWPLSDNPADGTVKNGLEFSDLLGRCAKFGQVGGRFRNSSKVFPELIFKVSSNENLVVELWRAVV